LEAIDDYRTLKLGLNPMCGRTYTRPPEESMQQAALWDRMSREDSVRQSQSYPGEEEGYEWKQAPEPGDWDTGPVVGEDDDDHKWDPEPDT
jgi:hypothetical protein